MRYSVGDRAVILRRQPLGEADLLLTLMTVRHGKLKVVAKGARRTTSHHTGQIELFSVINCQINAQSKIPIVSQVTAVAPASNELDPWMLQRLSLLAEITDHGMEEGMVNETIFNLLADVMANLRRDYQPMLFVGALLRLIGLLGYAPELRRCAVCSITLAAGEKYGWEPSLGGIVSGDCLTAIKPKPDAINEDELKALRFLQLRPLSDMGKLQTRAVDENALVKLMTDYCQYVLERQIKSANISLA